MPMLAKISHLVSSAGRYKDQTINNNHMLQFITMSDLKIGKC